MWVTPGGSLSVTRGDCARRSLQRKVGLTGRTSGTRIGLEPFTGAVLFEMPGESEGVHIFSVGAVL
jgi:hypothetical protein